MVDEVGVHMKLVCFEKLVLVVNYHFVQNMCTELGIL